MNRLDGDGCAATLRRGAAGNIPGLHFRLTSDKKKKIKKVDGHTARLVSALSLSWLPATSRRRSLKNQPVTLRGRQQFWLAGTSGLGPRQTKKKLSPNTQYLPNKTANDYGSRINHKIGCVVSKEKQQNWEQHFWICIHLSSVSPWLSDTQLKLLLRQTVNDAKKKTSKHIISKLDGDTVAATQFINNVQANCLCILYNDTTFIQIFFSIQSFIDSIKSVDVNSRSNTAAE